MARKLLRQVFTRNLSSQVLHSHPIPYQYLPIQDVDQVSRQIRYYDSDDSSLTILPSSSSTSPSSSPVVVDSLSSSPSPSPSSSLSNIPIIILCGTAQSIPTWNPHLRYFSSKTRLIIPELRCQGQTELLSTSGSLSQHIEDLHQFIKSKNLSKFNLIGFSLGGRIGLEYTLQNPQYVNKLSITGVPLTRTPLGHLILQSWKDGLDHQNYQATAWSCILNSFSNDFLSKNFKAIPGLVNSMIQNNDMNRLNDLLTHTLTSTSSLSTSSLSSPCPIQIICGQEDRIAESKSAKELSKLLEGSTYEEIVNCGHLVPFEKPAQWRTSVMKFFQENTAE